MVLDEIIKGKYITLRSVALGDDEFIVSIRNDNSKNTYLHATSTDISKQKEWISKQMEREGDYYFIISDEKNNPVGLASIYNVNEKDKSAEFGRWISWGTALHNLESAILCFDFAFEKLGINYIYTRTMIENTKVIRFWKKFGAESKGQVFEDDLWLDKSIIIKDEYYSDMRAKNAKLLRY